MHASSYIAQIGELINGPTVLWGYNISVIIMEGVVILWEPGGIHLIWGWSSTVEISFCWGVYFLGGIIIYMGDSMLYILVG